MNQTVEQSVAERVVDYQRFHKIFGPDIQLSLAITIPAGVSWSAGIPIDICERDLIYKHPTGSFVRLYYPAINDADMIYQNNGRVIFPSVFTAGEVTSYYISFWTQGIRSRNFWVRMARFGEERTFGFPTDRKPFINLVLRDDKVSEFKTLFLKARNRNFEENGRPKIMSFKLDVGFLEQGVEVDIGSVTEDECPPQLVLENP